MPFATDPRRSSPSSAAPRPAARPTTPASTTTGSAPSTASSGPARPPSTPARRGCSPTRSPPPTAGPASSPSSTAAPAEQPDADYPVHLTTGRVLAQYQSGAQTRRIRDLPDDGPFVELHPMLADRIGAARRRAGRRPHPPRRAEGAGPGGHHDPPGHGLRALPLGRRQPAHQRRPRPVQPDARVQGLRRGGRPQASIAAAGARSGSWCVGNGMAATRLVEELVAPRAPTTRSPCSATSRTRRTTGSCSRPCSRAPTGRRR